MTTANIKQEWAKSQNRQDSDKNYTEAELNTPEIDRAMLLEDYRLEVLFDSDENEYLIRLTEKMTRKDIVYTWVVENPTDDEVYANVDDKFKTLPIERGNW